MVNPPPIGGSFRFSFGLSARHVRKDQMHILFISAAMGKLRCLRLEEPRGWRILFYAFGNRFAFLYNHARNIGGKRA